MQSLTQESDIPIEASERDEPPVSLDDMLEVHGTAYYGLSASYPADDTPASGSCDGCGVEWSGDKEYVRERKNRHSALYHPMQCKNDSCEAMAAYRKDTPGRWNPHSIYCAYHAHEALDADYTAVRVSRPANTAAPRLPDDHPIEMVIQGAGGDD